MLENGNRWGIVLAAGEGNRVRGFLSALCGGRGIKQFCAVLGRKSLLEMTLDRAQRLIPRERIIVIVDKRHRPEASAQLADWPEENIVYQPANRETAPGILLPLAHVSHRDPDATVALFPSDHFVQDESGFARQVAQALVEAERFPQSGILLGMTPDRVEEGYGWICSSEDGRSTATRAVRGFYEKPSQAQAERLIASGALWNTFVFTARAAVLWQMTQRSIPELHDAFSSIRARLGTQGAAAYIEQVYQRIPTVNFSHAVLTPCTRQLRVLPVPDIGWSDWGSADRILDSALRLGRLTELAERLDARRIDPSIAYLLKHYQSRPAADHVKYDAAVGA